MKKKKASVVRDQEAYREGAKIRQLVDQLEAAEDLAETKAERTKLYTPAFQRCGGGRRVLRKK
jgi:hypothetical protein